jgi:hypothetical protein
LRYIYFVCCAIKNDGIITDVIRSTTEQEANEFFFNKFQIKPINTLGPFYKPKFAKKTTELNFTGVTKECQYDGWEVTAFYLNEPQNHVYIIFNNKIGEKQNTPRASIMIPISFLEGKY